MPDLAELIQAAVFEFSRTDGWPIVGDDVRFAEFLAGRLGEAGLLVQPGQVETEYATAWPAYGEKFDRYVQRCTTEELAAAVARHEGGYVVSRYVTPWVRVSGDTDV